MPPEGEILSAARNSLIKEDPGTQLSRMQLAGHEVMVKRYDYTNLFLRLRARIFPSRARREHQVLAQLLELGIPTLEPLAFGEIDAGPRRLSSYLITVFLDQAVTLEALLDGWPPRRERRRALATVARLVARAHQAGFLHGTLFPRNILLVEESSGELRPHLFDAPFGRFLGRPLTRAERVLDLVCLLRFAHPWLTRGEKARFLRDYLERPPTEGWGPEGRALAESTLASSAFTRSVRRKLAFHLRRLRGLPHPRPQVPPRPEEPAPGCTKGHGVRPPP